MMMYSPRSNASSGSIGNQIIGGPGGMQGVDRLGGRRDGKVVNVRLKLVVSMVYREDVSMYVYWL